MDKSDLLRKSLARIQELKSRVDELEAEQHEPIAIVGIGARFPAGISDREQLWAALLDGVDVIREIPESRWERSHAGATYAGMLDDPYGFDPGFFGVSEREARMMDPQQRLVLEVGWDALADAGLPLEQVRGSQTGVYVGAIGQDWTLLACADEAAIDAYTSTGASHAIIANRLSYLWDLRGPSLSVDVACASSLVAVHLAVAALRRRECDRALAGGVQLHLAPQSTLSLYRFNMMAPDGRCKAFDSRADGFVRSEGCALVVLERLSDALRNRHRIYGVIVGSALNQDGRSNGLTAPNALAQSAVLRAALRDARVAPEDVDYIEAHGTGTALGDPIEVEAIRSVYGSNGAPPCYLGAIKTNLGHTEGAAGIAGLVKAALVLHNRAIPKNLHTLQLNPDLGIEGTRFRVPTSTMPLPAPRHAAVSSFGFGGTNAHVVLGPAPTQQPAAAPHEFQPGFVAVPVSTHTRAEFGARARQLAALADHTPLGDLGYTTAVRSTHLSWRAVAVGSSAEGLARSLAGAHPTASPSTKPRVVFLFPGQGGQWLEMGAQLVAWSEAFRVALEGCERAIQSVAGWSLAETLRSKTELDRVDRVQPAIFAIQVALSALWQSLGVVPDAVMGTSMGEVAAAHAAGLLGLEDAVRIIAGRSRLVAEQLDTPGGMATVALAEPELRRRLEARRSDLEIAVVNSPNNLVVAGSPGPLEELLAELHAEGVFARRIQVDYASHCSHVDSLSQALQRELQGLQRGSSKPIPMLSTVTGEWLSDATAPGYWQDNLRQPVKLWPTITDVLRPDGVLFVEISPHPVLAVPLLDPLSTIDPRGHMICGMARGAGPEVFLEALGGAWARGVPVKWQQLYPTGQVVSLPSYPWPRKQYTSGARPLSLAPRSSSSAIVDTTAHDIDPGASDTLEDVLITTIVYELGLGSREGLRMDVPLRELGFDSLMASHLRAALSKFEIKVTLLDLLQAPSITHLVETLAAPQDQARPQRSTGEWLTRPRPRPDAAIVCICVPFGGGSASAFRLWADTMPDWLEIRAVEYPGRGTRTGEPWAESFEQVAEQLTEVVIREVDRPFVIYGHCSGSLVAYELAKRLVAAGRPPLHLYTGALRPPVKFNLVNLLDATDVIDGVIHEQEDEQLMNFLRGINFRGVEEFERDPELREMALTTLRADSRMAHRYRRASAEPLPIPITAIGGGNDPSVNAYDLWGWAHETSAGFDWRWFPAGDHYFLTDHIPEIVGIFEQLRMEPGSQPPKPRATDGLAAIDIVRCFHASRDDGPDAWTPFTAEDAEWVVHGLPGFEAGRHHLRSWFTSLPTLGSIVLSDVTMTPSNDDGVLVSCKVAVALESGTHQGLLEERYSIQNGRIVLGEMRYRPHP